jgi:hypothetical protein
MSGIQEAGRHNPTKHSYGSLDQNYDQDLLSFQQPYVRKVGLYHTKVPLAQPRFPQQAAAGAATESKAPALKPPPAAAATSFSAAELQAMSRQNVRAFHDPEGLSVGREFLQGTVSQSSLLQTGFSSPKHLRSKLAGAQKKCLAAKFVFHGKPAHSQKRWNAYGRCMASSGR